MGQDEAELAHAGGRELGGVEVLDDEDAVLDVEGLGDLEWTGRVLRRHGAVAPGVAAGQGHAARGEPLGHLDPRAWLGGEVAIGIVPVATPTGMEENGIPWPGIDVADLMNDMARVRRVHEPPARD